MKDIKAILETYEIDADLQKSIEKEVLENYRTIKELEKKENRINELTEQLDNLKTEIEATKENGAKIEELQGLIANYEKEEKARAEAEQEKAKRDSFREVFNAQLGERQFINDLMRDTVFEKAYSMCSENKGIGAGDAITAVTKDIEGVWVNPQHDVKKMPGTDLREKTPSKDETKKNFAKTLFGSADR